MLKITGFFDVFCKKKPGKMKLQGGAVVSCEIKNKSLFIGVFCIIFL